MIYNFFLSHWLFAHFYYFYYFIFFIFFSKEIERARSNSQDIPNNGGGDGGDLEFPTHGAPRAVSMLRQMSFEAGPGLIGPGALDRLPSMPLELSNRSRTDDFVFHPAAGGGIKNSPPQSMAPPLVRRESSLGYSQVPLQTSGMY